MKYRNALPQLNGKLMLADGGLETWLLFQKGIDLPLFAAFKALETQEGMDAIAEYLRGFAEIAVSRSCGLVLDTPTWRASSRCVGPSCSCRARKRRIVRRQSCFRSRAKSSNTLHSKLSRPIFKQRFGS